MKPTVFNYQEYERVVEENKKLNAEVADLRIRIADGDKRDCKSCKHQKADGCSRWNCEYEPRMDDLISRQDAIEAIASRDETDGTVKAFTGREVNEILSALPSADTVATFRTGQTYGKSTSIRELVEVVRCKDCKNRNENCGMGEHRWCEIINMSTRADDYCSYGKRREP